ncbi:MAG TPA: lactonase family protein [Gemmataceae bacterium]|nr:lactonase family protein [Gemmataceae bacterium]
MNWLCCGLLALLMAAVVLPLQAAEKELEKVRVYVGTYTGPKSKGIYLLDLNPKTGELTSQGLAGEARSPSFLAIHPSQKFLYAVGEIDDFQGKKTGGVYAFAIDEASGKLKMLNQQSSKGAGPCHIVVDKAGKNALVANYNAGSVAVLPIQADGKLAEASCAIQHEGHSVNPGRQKEPHAHSINLDPANHFAFAADLGTDKVYVYRFNGASGELTPNDPPATNIAPGSGPRHFAFHPSGKYAYVINELANTVVAFHYDAEKGVLHTIQTITTLPEGFKGESYTAEVVAHPSGKFLYGSNRHHDSIAAFSIDESTGKVTLVGIQGDKIKEPRNFTIDPTGKFLLVANQNADTVIVFRIDEASGKLEPTGISVAVPTPVCLRMIPIYK